MIEVIFNYWCSFCFLQWLEETVQIRTVCHTPQDWDSHTTVLFLQLWCSCLTPKARHFYFYCKSGAAAGVMYIVHICKNIAIQSYHKIISLLGLYFEQHCINCMSSSSMFLVYCGTMSTFDRTKMSICTLNAQQRHNIVRATLMAAAKYFQ